MCRPVEWRVLGYAPIRRLATAGGRTEAETDCVGVIHPAGDREGGRDDSSIRVRVWEVGCRRRARSGPASAAGGRLGARPAGGGIQQDGLALLAPQAARNTWYPNSFLSPAGRMPRTVIGAAGYRRRRHEGAEAGIPTDHVLIWAFHREPVLRASSWLAIHAIRRFVPSAAVSSVSRRRKRVRGRHRGTPMFLAVQCQPRHCRRTRTRQDSVFERLNGDVENASTRGWATA